HLFARVGVHLEQAADTLATAGAGVVHVAARGEGARVDAHEHEATDERVGGDLEGQGRGRGGDIGGTARLLARLGVHALDRRDVERARQVVGDRVEEALHALVLEGRAAHHREDLEVDGGAADGGAQRVDVG